MPCSMRDVLLGFNTLRYKPARLRIKLNTITKSHSRYRVISIIHYFEFAVASVVELTSHNSSVTHDAR